VQTGRAIMFSFVLLVGSLGYSYFFLVNPFVSSKSIGSFALWYTIIVWWGLAWIRSKNESTGSTIVFYIACVFTLVGLYVCMFPLRREIVERVQDATSPRNSYFMFCDLCIDRPSSYDMAEFTVNRYCGTNSTEFDLFLGDRTLEDLQRGSQIFAPIPAFWVFENGALQDVKEMVLKNHVPVVFEKKWVPHVYGVLGMLGPYLIWIVLNAALDAIRIEEEGKEILAQSKTEATTDESTGVESHAHVD
jgi:hypothetical protein